MRPHLLDGLAVLADVQSHDLVLLLHPERNERADDFQYHEGHHARPHQSDNDAIELSDDLVRIPLKQTGNSAGRLRGCRKCADCEHTGEQCTGEATNPVYAKYVERVVISDLEFEPGASPEANGAG